MLSSSQQQQHSVYTQCKVGDLDGIKQHFQSSTNPSPSLDEPDEFGNTMLYYSCLCGRLGIVRYLSELGARDDKYKRCFLNALNLDVRRMLKLYNVYHHQHGQENNKNRNKPSSSEQDEEDEEDNLTQVLKKYAMKCVHENRNDNKKDQSQEGGEDQEPLSEVKQESPETIHESNDDRMIVLKFKFADEKSVSEYKCHLWILLSRWPQFLHFVHLQRNNSQNHNLIQALPQNFLVRLESTDIPLFKCNSNKEVEEYVNRTFPQLGGSGKAFNSKCKQTKQHYRQIKEVFQFPFISQQDVIQKLPNQDTDLAQFMNDHLKEINFGVVPFKRKSFDTVLVWLYSGLLIDPSRKSSFLPSEVDFCTVCHDLVVMAKYLQLSSLMEMVTEHLYKMYEHCGTKFLQTHVMKKNQELLANDLDPQSYCKSSITLTNPIDKMKRMCCNMGITLAKDISRDDEHASSTPSTCEFIYCNKQFMMDRSLFFEVIINCSFEEGEKFRRQLDQHELPLIDFQQVSHTNVLCEIIRYSYSENVNIDKETILEVITLAQKLGFPKLIERCESYFSTWVTTEDVDNVFELFKIACLVGSSKLKMFFERKTIEYFREQTENGMITVDEVIESLECLGCDEDEISRFRAYLRAN
ncbi:hypothetical protein C9374_010071 [Naegleria lovaniensis]|uniref:BTB domain-containing protein n=1 Tax=Naegleria lovaniensis TaxID=51637 RepID=A0AA88KJN6_NAELO|nr:uncharacterized protein C9374_010071 [Naegleria lovaniensis]KAG2375067.1 hypothetical protein C9374_010071 [Naegleria lovaniensis]